MKGHGATWASRRGKRGARSYTCLYLPVVLHLDSTARGPGLHAFGADWSGPMMEREGMSDRQSATHIRDQQEASSGYFASLEWAKCILLTTFERDGSPVSAPVRGVVDGDRAYFWAWSRSGSVQRLQHTDAVQVTPCGARGLFIYGPPLEATARRLPGAEADRAAGKLARRHPVQ